MLKTISYPKTASPEENLVYAAIHLAALDFRKLKRKYKKTVNPGDKAHLTRELNEIRRFLSNFDIGVVVLQNLEAE